MLALLAKYLKYFNLSFFSLLNNRVTPDVISSLKREISNANRGKLDSIYHRFSTSYVAADGLGSPVGLKDHQGQDRLVRAGSGVSFDDGEEEGSDGSEDGSREERIILLDGVQ